MKKIQLWKNKNELSEYHALIDDEDYDRVMEAVGKGKWYAHAPAVGEFQCTALLQMPRKIWL
jgi:hypothetical protein